MRVGGDNGVEEGIDDEKGSGVGAYIVLYIYLVSAYRLSNSPLPQSVHFIPLLFHYSLKIGGRMTGRRHLRVTGTHYSQSVLAGRMTGRRHLRVTRSLMSSCSSANTHSLPCGPRVAEEKVTGWGSIQGEVR